MQRIIRRIVEADVETVVAFSLAAWEPVFAGLEVELGPEIYGDLFPDWRSAQARAVETDCRAPENDVWVTVVDDRPVGFVAVCFIDEDAARAGEIHMIAVDPAHQGAGVGASLVRRAVSEIKAQGVDLAVIAAGGDPGHAPARALYEKLDLQATPPSQVLPQAVNCAGQPPLSWLDRADKQPSRTGIGQCSKPRGSSSTGRPAVMMATWKERCAHTRDDEAAGPGQSPQPISSDGAYGAWSKAEMTSPAGDRLGLGSDRITWEQYELFCLALLNALPKVESATRYGVPGEHQEGIDIEVRFADGRTGGVQCRQRGRFGKPEFDQAVKDNEYETDRHIVMTTAPATVPARKAERQAPDWEIWDIDDLSVQVRQRLPRVERSLARRRSPWRSRASSLPRSRWNSGARAVEASLRALAAA